MIGIRQVITLKVQATTHKDQVAALTEFYAAAAGSTLRSTAGLQIGATAFRLTATTSSVSALPGLREIEKQGNFTEQDPVKQKKHFTWQAVK